MYTITANNKTYIVLEHAARRMLQRDIKEEWVVETLENGDVTEQPNGRDSYELQKWIEDYQEWIIIQVIVNEDRLIIVSVIDDTEDKEV